MDSIESSLKLAQHVDSSPSFHHHQPQRDAAEFGINDQANIPNAEKLANLLKLYDYQIVEMQHEYELLVEDKVDFTLNLNSNFFLRHLL